MTSLDDCYDDIPVVLDVAGVALILGCGERAVRNLIASRQLGHVRLGRLIRIPRHQLQCFLLSGDPDCAAAGPRYD